MVLYIYIYIYIYVRTYIYVYTYVRLYIHTYVCVRIRIRVRTYTSTYMRSWLRATKGSLCTVTVHAQCHTYAYCCGTNLVFFLLAKHPLAERHSRSIGEACLNGKHPNIIRCMLTREREPWLCDTTSLWGSWLLHKTIQREVIAIGIIGGCILVPERQPSLGAAAPHCFLVCNTYLSESLNCLDAFPLSTRFLYPP